MYYLFWLFFDCEHLICSKHSIFVYNDILLCSKDVFGFATKPAVATFSAADEVSPMATCLRASSSSARVAHPPQLFAKPKILGCV